MPKASRGALDDLALPRARLDAPQQQRVAEQHAEGGDGIDQQAAQQVLVGEHAGGLLPQAQQLGAQLVLHLRAVEAVVHLPAARSRRCRAGSGAAP